MLGKKTTYLKHQRGKRRREYKAVIHDEDQDDFEETQKTREKLIVDGWVLRDAYGWTTCSEGKNPYYVSHPSIWLWLYYREILNGEKG